MVVVTCDGEHSERDEPICQWRIPAANQSSEVAVGRRPLLEGGCLPDGRNRIWGNGDLAGRLLACENWASFVDLPGCRRCSVHVFGTCLTLIGSRGCLPLVLILNSVCPVGPWAAAPDTSCLPILVTRSRMPSAWARAVPCCWTKTNLAGYRAVTLVEAAYLPGCDSDQPLCCWF